MDDGDATGVMAHLLEVTKEDRPMKRVAAFSAVRTKILRNEQYRHPRFTAEVTELILQSGSITPHDRERLAELIKSPLHTIRHVQTLRGCIFDSKELYTKFCKIPCVVDPFYDFVVPPELQEACRRDRQKRVKENHSHHYKPSKEYHFSMEEIAEMRTTAITWCGADQDWNKRVNSMRLLEALGFLTGRRKWELCQTLKIRSVPQTEYQAEVRGIGKKLFDMEWRRIPLLAPLPVIVMGLMKVRRYAHTQGDYGCAKKLFPRLTHTRYRDIYATLAYEERDRNGFHPESCSELWWKSQALGNDLMTYTKHYATMVIDRDAKTEPLEYIDLDNSEVADSPCESRINIAEDLV